VRQDAGPPKVRLGSRGALYSSSVAVWIARSTRWLLRLLNPHAHVWVDNHPLHLGDSFVVEWSFRRGLTSLRDLRITFEGAELCADSDGEDTFTDVYVFSMTVIHEGPFDGAVRGSGQGTVPRSAMPSFGGSGARIEWAIHVTGTPRIPWPRVDDYFVVKVLPDGAR